MATSLNGLLTANNDYIYTASLRNRLNELEAVSFQVYRVRNDEVLYTTDSKNDATIYIAENDYNPERVKVRESNDVRDEDNKYEVDKLRKFRAAVVAAKGQEYWDTRDKALYELVPGTEVIEADGRKFALLKTVFR